MEKAEEICYNNEEERKRLRYLLMLNMTPEELKDFFPEDEIIKKFRDEIMRLNSDTKFIREISEEEEKNNAIKNLLKIKMPIKTIAIATDLTEEEVKKRIKEFKLEE